MSITWAQFNYSMVMMRTIPGKLMVRTSLAEYSQPSFMKALLSRTRHGWSVRYIVDVDVLTAVSHQAVSFASTKALSQKPLEVSVLAVGPLQRILHALAELSVVGDRVIILARPLRKRKLLFL